LLLPPISSLLPFFSSLLGRCSVAWCCFLPHIFIFGLVLSVLHTRTLCLTLTLSVTLTLTLTFTGPSRVIAV
jgi:hypothetical protein